MLSRVASSSSSLLRNPQNLLKLAAASCRRTIVLKSPYPFVEPPRTSFSEQILQRIWEHGCQDPAKPAIINAFNPAEKLSFKELYLRSLSVATFLHESGFKHGQTVATVLPNLIDFPAIVIGTGFIGGATTTAGVQLTPKELEVQFNDSKATIVFCADLSLEKVLEAAKNSPSVKKIVCLKSGLLPEDADALPQEVIDYEVIKKLQPELHWPQVEIDPERDIFVLPYSSGTTGPPKGTMMSNKNISVGIANFSTFFEKEVYPFMSKKKPVTANDPMQCFLPFSHSLGLITFFFNLYLGTPTIALPVFKFDQMCQVIQDYKNRVIFAVPPILIQLAHNPIVDKYDLSSLEHISAGAAPVPEDIMYACLKRLPNLQSIQQGYGMSETQISHCNSLRKDYPYGSVGKLLPGFEMKVVNPETKQELEAGEQGEVCLRSPQIMMGYLNRPSSTAAMKDDDGWLHTGDIGYFDEEGHTYIVDRLKELIKVKGLQVAPAELEALLLTHPKIKDAAVIGIEDEKSGELPRAYIVADEDCTQGEVYKFVREKAAPYKQLKGGRRLGLLEMRQCQLGSTVCVQCLQCAEAGRFGGPYRVRRRLHGPPGCRVH